MTQRALSGRRIPQIYVESEHFQALSKQSFTIGSTNVPPLTSMYREPRLLPAPGDGSRMYQVLNCLITEHDWRLVALAGTVCFLASAVAISLFDRARSSHG